jgi:hypothetical protein
MKRSRHYRWLLVEVAATTPVLKGLLLVGVSGWIWCKDVRVLGDKNEAVVVLIGP